MLIIYISAASSNNLPISESPSLTPRIAKTITASARITTIPTDSHDSLNHSTKSNDDRPPTSQLYMTENLWGNRLPRPLPLPPSCRPTRRGPRSNRCISYTIAQQVNHDAAPGETGGGCSSEKVFESSARNLHWKSAID